MISDKLAFELQQESVRWKDDNYFGVVFVHPDDKENVVNYIFDNYLCKLNHKRSELTFNGAYAGKLKVTTLEDSYPDSVRLPHHDYAGTEVTTCIISADFTGKMDENFNVKYVNRKITHINSNSFLMYMMSRLRTQVDCHPRMIIV